MSTETRTTVEDLMHRITQMQDKANVKTVFGEPIQINGRTVIPVAKVRYMLGLGMGRGGARETGEGSGGGGGGGTSVQPMAIIEIKADEVKVTPIPDVTRLALAGMALVAWNVFWIAATIRKAMIRKAQAA